jgi:hypothetical protein
MIFTPETIQSRLREKPFTPMRIITTAGQTYDVYHPDLIFVAEQFIIVGLPSSKNPALASQVTRVALAHITELHDLPRPVTLPSNGPAV